MECENAVIGGGEAHTLMARGAFEMERLREIHTPYGESQPIYLVYQDEVRFIFMSRHGEYSHDISAPYVNYRANIYALKELGAKQILAWSGPGAINPQLKLGQYFIPDDVIDETHGRETTFFEGRGAGLLRQNPVFCPRMSQAVEKTLEKQRHKYKRGGTYVCTQGPRLETPAEIRKFRAFGGELVGMTAVPECFLARELEICYLPVCYISNYAEGVRKSEYQAGVLFEGLNTQEELKIVQKAIQNLPRVILETFRHLSHSKIRCNCQHSMDHYKQASELGPEWHEWIKKQEMK